MKHEDNEEIEVSETRLYAILAGLLDEFQASDLPISIYRNCRLLAVGKIEWLIFRATKIWHIDNVISFAFDDIKDIMFSVETGHAIYLKDGIK